MTRVKVLDFAALPDGAVELVVAGGFDVALFRRGDEIFAIGNECAHKGGNLCDGRVEGDIVTCPLHGWEYDFTTGCNVDDPSMKLHCYAVKVEGDDVMVEGPAAGIA